MKVIEHRIKFPRSGPATILAGSCWHIGQPAVHWDGIALFMERAKQHTWIHHGDIIEGIMAGDKRFSVKEHGDAITNCCTKASEIISEASKTCIGLLQGNHEAAPSRSMGDLAELIALNARVPYLQTTCAAKLLCPNGELTAFWAHGNGSAMYKTGEPERKKANRKVKLRDILAGFDFDLVGMGHLHRGIITPPCFEMKLNLMGGKVKRRPVETRSGWYYAAPSMFRTYNTETGHGNYGESALYPSTDIGWCEVVVNRDGSVAALRRVDEDGNTIEEVEEEVVS